MSKRLWLVDGTYLFWRGFHAPSADLSAPCSCEGYDDRCKDCSGTGSIPTKAIYHFTRGLLNLIRDHKPKRMVVVFDGPRHLLRRKEIYPDYKCNREQLEAENWGVSLQKKWVRRIVDRLNLCSIICGGYEADDALATLAQKWTFKPKHQVVIVSRDKDLMCLLDNPGVLQFDPLDGKWFNSDGVRKKFGINPCQIPDYLCLLGDSADNVPGVPGWGPKKSSKYLGIYKTLDRLLSVAHAGNLPAHLSKNLVEAERLGTLALARKLIKLDCSVQLNVNPRDFIVPSPFSLRGVRPLLDWLGFRNI